MAAALGLEYEPQDKPITKANARFEILSSVAELAPDVVEDLFKRCFASFLSFAKHKDNIGMERYLAETAGFHYLADNYREIWDKRNQNLDSLEAKILANLHRDKKALRQCLIDWGETYGLTADWCYEFGLQVLRYLWKEQQAVRTPSLGSSSKTMEGGANDPNLLPIAKGPLSGAFRLNTPKKTRKEKKEERELKKAKINFENSALESFALRLKEKSGHRNSSVSSLIASFSRPIKSWVIIAHKHLNEAPRLLFVPESDLDNLYELQGTFPLSNNWRAIPAKSRPLKPPQPPPYVSPIADWQPDRQNLISKREYEQRIKAEIWEHLHLGITKNNPPKRLEVWSKNTFEYLKPSIDKYWDEYMLYLKAQGWVKVDKTTELRQYCQWFTNFVVCGHKLKDFAKPYTDRYVSTKIHKVADWADLLVPDRRGHR